MNLNFISPINVLSYGVAGTNIIKELAKLDVNIALWPIGAASVNSNDKDIFQTCINNTAKYDVNAPCIRLYHQFSLDQFVGKGPHIGWPIFELDKFNEVELHHLKNCDKLFVCSQWAKTVIENNLPSASVEVVPLGVDTTIFHPTNYQVFPPTNAKPYVFMNVGKIETRKGHDILVEIFNRAFTLEDDVELWIMWTNPFLSEEEHMQWAKPYKTSKLGEKIHFIDRCNTQSQVAGLMRQTHCGIFPSRAEGWNLPLLEMMACGKPCITTNYAAHTEFCNNDNSYLVNVEEKEDAIDGKWFFGQGQWAKIGEKQIDQFVEYMRFMYKNRPCGENAFNSAKKFSWQNSAQILKNYLENEV